MASAFFAACVVSLSLSSLLSFSLFCILLSFRFSFAVFGSVQAELPTLLLFTHLVEAAWSTYARNQSLKL